MATKTLEPNRARGRPKEENTKQAVSLRLKTEVLKIFRATSPGCQTRMNDVLKAYVQHKLN